MDTLPPFGTSTSATTAPLSWDEYFLLIAFFTSLRSKDPRSKVGAVIVDPQHHILGTGYNGFVGGADETIFSWDADGDWLETKYPYVVHAEKNAILNSTTHDLHSCHIYTTLFPCNECALMIAQKNISEVIYFSDKHAGTPARDAASKIFAAANVTTRQMQLPAFADLAQEVLEKMQTP